MNFSNAIKFSGLSIFSPNGRYLAISKGVDAIIYETEGLKLYQKFTFIDFISTLEWAPDSSLLLVGLYKRGICEVKSLDNPDWQCKIDEGLAGMANARWAPDSRRILTICEFNIRMTIWSLVDKSTVYINYPKFNDKALSYTSNGYFMALAERRESKDYIGIYYVGDWSLVSHFPVDSYDLQDISWSKDNTAIIVVDSVLECKFFIYSPTGNLIITHEPYQMSLGIKNFNMSPNGHYLTLGFYDQCVRLYNHITWKLIIDFAHPATISDETVNIFREEEKPSRDIVKETIYVECSVPVKLTAIKPQLDKPNPQIGIKEMSWSFDSNFLATKNDNIPNVLWIWQISSLSLHTVIIQLKPIKHFAWSPIDHILLYCTENSKLYSFTLTNVYTIELVSDVNYSFGANQIQWNGDGKTFIVSDKNSMIIGHPEINENSNEEHFENEGNRNMSKNNYQEEEQEQQEKDNDNEHDHDNQEEEDPNNLKQENNRSY